MNKIELAVATIGSQAKLARATGVTIQAVGQWVKNGRAPPARCMAIEQACAGKITRYELRPDFFGPPPAKAA